LSLVIAPRFVFDKILPGEMIGWYLRWLKVGLISFTLSGVARFYVIDFSIDNSLMMFVILLALIVSTFVMTALFVPSYKKLLVALLGQHSHT
jgi:hypothetical protein